MRDRSVECIERKILKVLSKREYVRFYLAMSALVLEEVRSVNEQRRLDAAIVNLLAVGKIRKWRDYWGTCYALK